MNMTEKNGQPSMEEILASIRRIIAEEPAGQYHGELRGTPIILKGDGVLDDAGDFDLPAIFRSSPPAAVSERSAPLLGRLTDAIRSATAAQPEGRSGVNGTTYAHAEFVDDRDSGSGAARSDYPVLSSLKPVRPDNRAAEASISERQPLPDAELRAEPAPAAALASPAPAAEEPRRVMAAFKDTHFLRMTAPVAAIAPPSPLEVVDVPAPAPVEAAEPEVPIDLSALVPLQFERSMVHNEVSQPVAPEMQLERPSETVADVAEAALSLVPATLSQMPPPLPVAAAAEATDSVEDTTADLLRPMLRQWLADNMPRMVEKALHIEIAESVKGIKKP